MTCHYVTAESFTGTDTGSTLPSGNATSRYRIFVILVSCVRRRDYNTQNCDFAFGFVWV